MFTDEIFRFETNKNDDDNPDLPKWIWYISTRKPKV